MSISFDSFPITIASPIIDPSLHACYATHYVAHLGGENKSLRLN